MSSNRQFLRAYGVSDVAPLPHYYEEVFPHAQILNSLGFRGDRYYLFYSKDGHGQAYYEANEKVLSAEYYFEYFSKKSHQDKYFRDLDSILKQVDRHLEKLNRTEISQLNTKELSDELFKTYELDSLVFSYFLVCQPHRTQLFEEEVKNELKKRVASQRVDAYLARLAVSSRLTRMGEEEKDWLGILIKHHATLGAASADRSRISVAYPELYHDVHKHFETYKILTVGDGSWNFNETFFLSKLKQGAKLSLEQLRSKFESVKSQPRRVASDRKKLAKELYLEASTVEILDFLADLGYYRFNLRVDGFMPLIMAHIGLSKELARRLGVTKQALSYLAPEELKDLVSGKNTYTNADAAMRIGKYEEFLIFLNDKKIETLYGDAAGTRLHQLIPHADHENSVEVSGSPAMTGLVRGRVCLYSWGDDLAKKLKTIKKYPILVAGHTRPAMMPLIREATGIVTDEGGVTSHAAIVARELGLPSVIGTQNATLVFKEGDLVELDANTGIVRKLS